MLTLPITLPVGVVLIYGEGVEAGVTGIEPNNTVFKFGQVSQAWDGGEVFVYGNPNVMFKEQDVINRLYYFGYPYTMIEQGKLAGIETPLP